MSVLVHGNDENFAAWAARQIEICEHGFGPCRTLAIATGYEATDQLLAVAVYHDYSPMFQTVALSIAHHPTAGARWCTRGNIHAILAVPFERYRVRKVWTIFDIKNKAAEGLRELVGFTIEGRLRHQFGPKRHAVITGMTAEEYFASWGRDKPAPASRRKITQAAHVPSGQLHAG